MVFLRALFVLNIILSHTVQSCFLMLLLLVANPFQISGNYFLVFYYLCCFHSSVLACGMRPALYSTHLLPQGDERGNESEAHDVSIRLLPRPHLNEFEPLHLLVRVMKLRDEGRECHKAIRSKTKLGHEHLQVLEDSPSSASPEAVRETRCKYSSLFGTLSQETPAGERGSETGKGQCTLFKMW